MSRNAKDIKTGSNDFQEKEVLAPNGYPARVAGLVFVGVQKQRPYQGQPKDPADEVRVTYEFSHEFMKDKDGNVLEDKPRWITESFPFKAMDLDRAKSTKRYKAIDPQDEAKGDWRNLIGKGCTVLITNNAGKGKHEGKVFENIGDVSAAPNMPGYEQPTLQNEPFYYDLHDDACTLEDFRALPEFVQEIILKADDYASSHLAKLLGAENGKPGTPSAEEAPASQETDEDNPF